MKILFTAIAIFLSLVTCNELFASNYLTDDGYKVELHWTVKHKRTLKIWGAISKGVGCTRLKLHIGMKHNDGWYRNMYKTYDRPYSDRDRFTFSIEKKHHSKTLPKNGWYPDYIDISCDTSFHKVN